MRKRSGKILLVGILISSCVCFILLRHQDHGNVERHFIVKRQVDTIGFDEESRVRGKSPSVAASSSVETANDDDSLLPGQLICEPLTDLQKVGLTIPAPTSGTGQSKPDSDLDTSLSQINEKGKSNNMTSMNIGNNISTNESKVIEGKEEKPIGIPPVEVPSNKLPIVTGWREPRRNIGCCPPGDRNGRAFSEGMACCVDQVYNGSDQFCCLLKETVLLNNRDNQLYCFPPDRIPFCRIADLNLQRYHPMTVECSYRRARKKTPTDCTFICPPGSHVRGNKTISCFPERGVWGEVDPQCCEGCQSQFTQDFWFMMDINVRVGEANLASMRSFIRMLTGYFPISQKQTRVAVSAFNRVVFTSQNTWFLNSYNSTSDLHSAINFLPSEGSGRNTSQAVLWLAKDAFTDKNGDRPQVQNTVVLITTGPPDDNSLQDAAENLRNVSRLIVVAVGEGATYPLFREIVSSPKEQNFLRVPTFHDLDDHEKYLYDLFCHENCLGRDP